ncbi:hypothetical protein [Cesiribacter andamanensis]|uniref:Uncharacterized protein n=1 Tax=Cesiribacter andamanensis AMV16 TaxID=1279009 RepID=M7MX94_9BACT|nr:hypothetical protein [Cesiribacter andamanensis]EMR01053.1 hypothetical protein ADICEAN_03824 [Cesiribacter andamanensis AMV16]
MSIEKNIKDKDENRKPVNPMSDSPDDVQTQNQQHKEPEFDKSMKNQTRANNLKGRDSMVNPKDGIH